MLRRLLRLAESNSLTEQQWCAWRNLMAASPKHCSNVSAILTCGIHQASQSLLMMSQLIRCRYYSGLKLEKCMRHSGIKLTAVLWNAKGGATIRNTLLFISHISHLLTK